MPPVGQIGVQKIRGQLKLCFVIDNEANQSFEQAVEFHVAKFSSDVLPVEATRKFVNVLHLYVYGIDHAQERQRVEGRNHPVKRRIPSGAHLSRYGALQTFIGESTGVGIAAFRPTLLNKQVSVVR